MLAGRTKTRRDSKHCVLHREESIQAEGKSYCSNMAKSGMNPKTIQYLMGHSDIGVTLNTYTHLGLEDAADELKRMEDLEIARKELEKAKGEKPVSQKMFRAI